MHEMEKVAFQAKRSGLDLRKVVAIIDGRMSVLRKEWLSYCKVDNQRYKNGNEEIPTVIFPLFNLRLSSVKNTFGKSVVRVCVTLQNQSSLYKRICVRELLERKSVSPASVVDLFCSTGCNSRDVGQISRKEHLNKKKTTSLASIYT